MTVTLETLQRCQRIAEAKGREAGIYGYDEDQARQQAGLFDTVAETVAYMHGWAMASFEARALE